MSAPKYRMGIESGRLKSLRLKLGHLPVFNLCRVRSSAMKTIRTFIAIPLCDEVRQATIRMIRRLGEPDDGIRWVPTDNLHLTLKFLGEVDNTEVPRICNLLREICSDFEPFELSFQGTGGFPDLDRARVLYAGVDDQSQSLTELVTRLERELADLGFKPEPRDYTPHLTLGRTKGSKRKATSEVIQRMKDLGEIELGSMSADTVCVFASFMDKEGPTYQVMDTIQI